MTFLHEVEVRLCSECSIGETLFWRCFGVVLALAWRWFGVGVVLLGVGVELDWRWHGVGLILAGRWKGSGDPLLCRLCDACLAFVWRRRVLANCLCMVVIVCGLFFLVFHPSGPIVFEVSVLNCNCCDYPPSLWYKTRFHLIYYIGQLFVTVQSAHCQVNCLECAPCVSKAVLGYVMVF